MTGNSDDIWKDCNCTNCRLARIEDNIMELKVMIDSFAINSGEGPKEGQF
ncbi:MAG: hypothetical protein V3U20_08950 [Thermoplasmata archaeon]